MKMRRHIVNGRSIRGAVALVAVLAGLLVAAPHSVITPARGDDQDADEGVVVAPNRVTITNGTVVLTLSAADEQNVGIVTAHPVPAPAQRTVIGYGEVLDMAPLVALGNRYLDATAAVRVAEAKLVVSRAAFERAKVLHRDAQNLSTAQLQAAEGSFAVDEADLAATRGRRHAVAELARQDWGDTIAAALIGHTPWFADLVDRRDYLVKVTLPPNDSIGASPGTALIGATGGRQIKPGFVSAAPVVNPSLQGPVYFYEAPAASGLLPGLRLAVSLSAASTAGGAIVPEAAVVWLQGKAWIYVRIGPLKFERREIRPDRAAPDGGYIVRGVPTDADIVVRGAQVLLSEEFRAQAPIED